MMTLIFVSILYWIIVIVLYKSCFVSQDGQANEKWDLDVTKKLKGKRGTCVQEYFYIMDWGFACDVIH